MLRILGSPKRLCNGSTRREMLRAGGLSLLGIDPATTLRDRTSRPLPLVFDGRVIADVLA